MKSQKQKPAVPWPLVVLFFILAAAAVVVGLLFYESQKKQNLDISTKELSAIADLKVKQIIQWRSERISDGSNFRENVTLMKQFSRFLDQPGNTSLRNELFEDLKALTENYDYRNVIFVDRDCNVVLYYPEQDTVIGTYLEALLNRTMLKGEITVTDLLRNEEINFPHLDMLVPLKGIGGNDTTVFGALVLRIDPEKILYPLIQSWPSTTITSEAILFHREGDSIVYLNELRHLQDSGKVLRRSITDEKLVDAKALQGIMETTDAIDYREVPVIAAMKKVPESSWFLVAKVDRKEVYSSIQPNLRLIVIIIILFIFAIGSLLGFFWWNQRVRFYRQKYETELDRLALVRHFDYILKYANDIILLIDKDFTIIEANDKALETYMYNREEFIGQPFSILHSYISMKEFENDFKPLDDIGYATFEAYHKRKDGSIFPIEISARRVDIEGVKYYQSISRNITERKIAEETLKESEEKFRNIFEESPLSIAVTGKDMVILRANSAYCRMLGYSEEELLGMTFKDFTHPDHIQADELAILKLVSREINIYHTEKRYLKNDGSIIWGSATISIIRNKDDEIHFFLEMVEDITSKIIAAAQLEKSFSLQKATLESTEDGILVVDTNRKIVQFNRKFADMWRIPEDIIQSGEDSTVIKYVQSQLKDPEKFVAKIDRLYSDPEAITSDLIEFVDGRFFERYSQPQKLSGVTVGRVWSFRNITDRKKAEAEIIAAKERAEESDRLKTAFLHNISHEIRTPMNAIMGFSSLLNDPDLAVNERIQFTEIILQSGNQLLSIINDIVDLASIESGQMKLKMRSVNINNSLRSLCEQFSYKEKHQKVKLKLKTTLNGDDAEIMTDPTKLVQILSNLINNALKFTVEGRIDIGYKLKNACLEFYVKDTGIGIPEVYQPKVFQRFYQVENSVSRQYSGTGLGLSICKAYTELLGGEIWLKSKPGEGTTFNFTIPYLRKNA